MKMTVSFSVPNSPGTVDVSIGGPFPLPRAVLERAPGSRKAAHSDPRPWWDESSKFREDLFRRQGASFPLVWGSGGLND